MEVFRTYFKERVTLEDCGHSTPCWLWKSCTRDGYGRLGFGRRIYQTHRVSYEAFKGEIPEGLHIDHLCFVTNCINPEHLEAVTPEENHLRKCARRGYVVGGKKYERGPRGIKRLRERCKHGHLYTPETTKICINGKGQPYRACRICMRADMTRKNERRRHPERAAANGNFGGRKKAAGHQGNVEQSHIRSSRTSERGAV